MRQMGEKIAQVPHDLRYGAALVIKASDAA